MNEARDELAQAMERLKAKGLCPLTLSVRGPGEAASVTAEGASSGVGPLHGTIFEVRPDAGAIVTARPRWASALWLLSQPMPGIFDEQVRQLGRRVDRLGDPEGLKSHHSAFLYDEGVVCLGVTLERAVFNVELLEKCAEAYLLASATGRRVTRVPLWVREIAFHRLKKDQLRAAEAWARGEVPSGFTAY